MNNNLNQKELSFPLARKLKLFSYVFASIDIYKEVITATIFYCIFLICQNKMYLSVTIQ